MMGGAMTSLEVDNLLARAAAQDAVTGVFVGADRRDWARVAELLGPTIALDYTELSGGEPGEVLRDELLASWRQTLGGFEATQHLLGSFVYDEVSPTVVRLRFYAIATHVLHEGHGAHIWTVAGHYDAAVVRADTEWQVSELAFHPDWGDGNQQLVERAATRGQT
jgi:hypothetical protein